MSSQDRMTINEISQILNISINTLQRKTWRKRTGCPLIKMGRCLISFRPMLNDWLEHYNG